jgi:hypothetical protein
MTNKIDEYAIGIEVSWPVGFGDSEAVTVSREAVRQAVRDNGFPADLVDNPMPATALRKALQLVKGRSKKIVVQEIRRPNRDTPMSIGVYQVQPSGDESGDNVVCGARARVQPGGHVQALSPEGGMPIPECTVVAQELARIANTLVDRMVNREISDILTRIGWDFGWITRRRNSGGVYFIAAGLAAERFVGLLQDLQALTEGDEPEHRFIPQIMEVYAKPLTMAMWAHSASDQFDSEVADLVEQLKKITVDSTRDSTIERRAEDCDRLIAKAENHRLFLQDRVETLTSEIRKIQAGFAKKLREAREGTAEAFDAVAEAPKKIRMKVAGPVSVRPVPVATPPKRVRMRQVAGLKPREQMSNEELFDI